MYQCETTTPFIRERDPWNDVRNDEETRDKLVVPSYTHVYAHTSTRMLRRVELRRIENVVPAQIVKTRNYKERKSRAK